jgi:hypothetical protein
MTLCELLDRLGACTGWTMRKHHAALLEIIEMAEKFGAEFRACSSSSSSTWTTSMTPSSIPQARRHAKKDVRSFRGLALRDCSCEVRCNKECCRCYRIKRSAPVNTELHNWLGSSGFCISIGRRHSVCIASTPASFTRWPDRSVIDAAVSHARKQIMLPFMYPIKLPCTVPPLPLTVLV